MAKQQPQNNGPAPGALFRVPKLTTQRRFIPDANNSGIVTTLAAGSAMNAQTAALDRLDILRSLLFQIVIEEDYTEGMGETITESPLFPYNFVGEIDVQFESAFKTFRQPGFIAAVMQQYRPIIGWKGPGMLTNGGVNAQQSSIVTSAWNQPLADSGLLGDSITDATSPLNLMFEVPLAFEFDLYWELDKAGNPLGQGPIPRAIVSPQYMSGTTRNVRPSVQYNPAMLVGAAGQALNSPANIDAMDVTSAFAGEAELSIWRDGWFAPSSLVNVPPIYRWQYSRDFITIPTNGQGAFTVPLDSDPAGQGQILSLILCVWDPALNSGAGGMVDLDDVATVELLFGSALQLANDNIAVNAYKWLEQHGSLLPPGFFGWDLALDESYRLTNEFALNTLVTAGCQVRVSYNSGSAPSSNSTCYVGLEMLKAVSS